MAMRIVWIVAASVAFVLTLAALHAGGSAFRPEEAQLWKWLYAGINAAFGLLLLGAIARIWPRANPPLWRFAMLALGAALAGAGMWLLYRGGRLPRLEIWMAALLGLACAAILPRLLPESVLRRWFGMERRHPER